LHQREEVQHRRQRYYLMILYLKRDGLIEEQINQGARSFILTLKGRQRVRELRTKSKTILPLPIYNFKASSNIVIIAFDIPEKQSRKRVWLRSALKNMRFTMIQRSVWLGKVKIPKEFMTDLHHLQMTAFVEVFSITKSGSLRHLR